MKNRRMIFGIVLIVLMAFSACTKTQTQQYDPESDFKAEALDNGQSVMITEYLGSKQVVYIPPLINELPVTHIGQNAFFKKQLTSVTIPSSVTSIDDYAFAANRLTSMTIPNSVIYIGEGAFGGNQLTNVSIPNTITSISKGVFGGNQLSSITIPTSVISIGDYAFGGNQLTSVTIPSSVTSIGDDAFAGNRLTDVSIPNSITSINKGVFTSNQLTTIIIPSSVTSIGDDAFRNNPLTSVTIPSSVTFIGDYAFAGNQLEYVTTPNSVTHLGEGAFAKNTQTNTQNVTTAQNGYKEYTWGMSVNQVKAISTDLAEVSENRPFDNIARNALMYLHYSELAIKDMYLVPKPMEYESGAITKYQSRQNDLIFYFLTGRLVAVELSFMEMNIISDLERQNGKVNPISWLNGSNQTATWNKEPNRMIYWLSTGGWETVAYIDKKWLAPLIDKAMEEYKKEQSNTRSRLD